MPLNLADRVRDTTTTTGTGTVTLSGTAPTGYQDFSVIGNGNTTYYTINAGSQWEVGVGTYSSTGPTLSRDAVLESSNANALVDFAAGVKDVFVTYPSDKAISDGYGLLPVANGGTGVTTSTGTGSVVLNTSPTLVTPTLGAASATSIANGLGAVGTPSYTFTGDLNTGMWSPSSDAIAFSTAGSERVRVTSAGNVGIGTASPDGTLHVHTSSAGAVTSWGNADNLTVESSGATGISVLAPDNQQAQLIFGSPSDNIGSIIRWVHDDNELQVGTHKSDGFLTFRTAIGSERMRIASGGNVGIGTTSPGFILDVQGSTANTSRINVLRTGGAGVGVQILSTGSDGGIAATNSGPLNLYTSDLERMRVTAAGNVGIGTTAPTFRLVSANSATDGGWLYSAGAVSILGLGGYQNATDGAFSLRYDRSSGAITFNGGSRDTPTERMRITSAGNVGIGTTIPSSDGLLSVNGNIVFGPLTRNQATTLRVGSWAAGDPADNTRANIGFSTVAGVASSSSFITFTTNDYGVSGGERMRIDSSGNVGIGTASPSQRLDVNGNINVSGTGQFTNATYCQIGATSGTVQGQFAANAGGEVNVRAVSNHPMNFFTNNTERMRITSAGNVGIGTTAPSALLHVAGDAYVGSSSDSTTDTKKLTVESRGFAGLELLGDRSNVSGEPGGAFIRLTVDGGVIGSRIGVAQGANQDGEGGTYTGVLNNATYMGTINNSALQFGTNNNIRMTVTGAGNVGIGLTNPSERLHVSGNILASGDITAFSDERLKTNITTVDKALDKVRNMRGVTYRRKDTGEFGVGVIAQEMLTVLPEVVNTNGEHMSVAYGNIVGVLIEAIKELKAEVEELKGSKS